MSTKHRHTWHATLYDGRWVEYCASSCGVPYRKARINRWGNPVALARTSPGAKIERGQR